MIQIQTINYILDKKDYSIIINNGLTVDFFNDVSNEFNFIKNHVAAYGNVPDKSVFLSKFPNFQLFEVDETPEYLVNALYEDKNKRKIIDSVKGIVSLMNSGNQTEAENLFKQAVEEMKGNAPLHAVDIYHDNTRYKEYLERVDSPMDFYVPTGFKELDEVIGGWDRKGEYATIVARPNIGKSWILLKCAVAAVDAGLRVGMYSGEMTVSKVGYRADTLDSHIYNKAMTRGKESIQLEYQQYFDKLMASDKHFYVLTPEMIGGLATVDTLRAFIEKYDLEALFIDQHSLLEDARKAKSPVERAANISKDIKSLQVLKQIPIITASQQNRTSTENGVDTSHVAASDRISQDSTILLFLEQETIGEMPTKRITLNLLKSRDSENGKKLSYLVDFNAGQFNYDEEASSEETETSQETNNFPYYDQTTPF